MTVFHVEITHRCKLLSASRVKNLKHTLLSVNFDLLSVGVFYRWVVLLYEDALCVFVCGEEREKDIVLIDSLERVKKEVTKLKAHFPGKTILPLSIKHFTH